MLWFLLVVVVAVGHYSRSALKQRWPDGPRGLGILPDKNLKLYQQLAKLVPRYGDFLSVRLGMSKVVVLSSPAAVDELFTKRGGKYASRPTASPQAKIIGQARLVAMPYGDDFRVCGPVVLPVSPSCSDCFSPSEASQARTQPPRNAKCKDIPAISGVREPTNAKESAGKSELVLLRGSTLLDQCHFQSFVSSLLMLANLRIYLPSIQTWSPTSTRRCEDSRSYAGGFPRHVHQ